MHPSDPLDRWEEEQRATADPTLRDYARVAKADPGLAFGFVLSAFVVVYSALTAARMYPDLVSAVLATLAALAFGYIMVILLDAAACRADPEHACLECEDLDERYAGGDA